MISRDIVVEGAPMEHTTLDFWKIVKYLSLDSFENTWKDKKGFPIYILLLKVNKNIWTVILFSDAFILFDFILYRIGFCLLRKGKKNSDRQYQDFI